jgi:hypothetical protein
MYLIALYVKHRIMVRTSPWYSGYPPLSVNHDFINRPINLPNESDHGSVAIHGFRGDVEAPLYTSDQISRHLDYLKSFTGDVTIKVIGDIHE